MSDSCQDQIFILRPYIESLKETSAFKKDKALTSQLQSAEDSFNSSDVTPCVDLLVNSLAKRQKDIRTICIHAISDLLSTASANFFFSANHSSIFLHNIIEIVQDFRSTIFNDSLQCLSHFLLSQNQQLYVHDKELTFVVTSLLSFFDQCSQPEPKKAIETALRRYIHSVIQMASKSTDKLILSDFKDISVSVLKFVTPSVQDSTAILCISLIHTFSINPPQPILSSTQYRELLLVELPQFFIQYTFSAPQAVFQPLTSLFSEFLSLSDLALPSFPAIIDQLLITAIESQSKDAPKAIAILSLFTDIPKTLLTVFAISDCNSAESHRVFESIIHAIAKCITDINPVLIDSAVLCLTKILSGFRKAYDSMNSPAKAEEIEQTRGVLEQKMTVEGCAARFNESPKKGVISMRASELINDDPKAIAAFLKSCNLLHPNKLSEFLSSPPNDPILKAYVETFDFKGKELDLALRDLCSSFRLPGESQEIDRVMMAFAKKYHADNPNISEDAAYVVSFSIIMLHTDLHNPNVVKKITAEQWIENTYNVKEAKEISEETLKDIYSRVIAKPMKLTSSDLKKKGRKLMKKLVETKEIPQPTPELLLLIIDRLWPTFFACFSLCLERGVSLPISLQSLGTLVFFLSRYSMSKEVETVVNFLCQYCQTSSSIMAIRTILAISYNDGSYIGEGWVPILRLFSWLMRPEISDVQISAVDSSAPHAHIHSIPNLPIKEIETIYSESVSLKGTSFPGFLRALCEVSTEELFENPPLLFSLQKVFEVATENFERERFVWNQAFAVINSHFCRAGCLEHETIAMYTIDGVRQLIMKAIEDNNRWKYLQNSLVMPLYVIFQNQILDNPRRLIIQCIQGLVREAKFTSSWDVILDIFDLAAGDSHADVVAPSFKIIQDFKAEIPEAFHSKLIQVLLRFAKQRVIPAANVPSMAFVLPIAVGIKPVTKELLTEINGAMSCNPGEVKAFATNLYFMLLVQFCEGKELEPVFSEYVLPLFSEATIDLVEHFFDTFIESFAQKAAFSLDPVCKLLIKIGDSDIIDKFVEKCIDGLEKGGIEKECADSLLLVLQSNCAKASHFEDIVMHCKPSMTLAKLIDFTSVNSACFGAGNAMMASLGILFSLYDANPEVREEATAITFISVLNSLYNNECEVENALEFLCKAAIQRKWKFLAKSKNDLQKVLFNFYCHPSEAARKIVKEMAMDSINLSQG